MSATDSLCILSTLAPTGEAVPIAAGLARAHELHFEGPDLDPALVERAEVIFGQPSLQLVEQAVRVSWVQLSSAGYTRFSGKAVRARLQQRGIALTTSSSVYGDPCAEHVLGLMLADARGLFPSFADQRGGRKWLQGEVRAQAHLLTGQSAVLLGFGSIARRLLELLSPFRMRVVGFRRQPVGDEPIPIVTRAELDGALATADHVVNLLPEAEDTGHFFDRRRFETLKPGARFYNIGRGSTVDQTALLEVLNGGRLGAAFLDVTDPEPLPPEHPLWHAPNCFITPHVAGGHGDESRSLFQHFSHNLERHLTGTPLLDRVL